MSVAGGSIAVGGETLRPDAVGGGDDESSPSEDSLPVGD